MGSAWVVMALAVGLALLTGPAGGAAPSTVVVRSAGGSWLERHAADELARYARSITGRPVSVVAVRPTSRRVRAIVLSVGKGSEPLRRLAGAADPERLRDGFVIRSGPVGELRISATQPIGLLYGVYDYLERFCDVGFFWDGDRIPHRAALPTRGIRLAQLPRWPLRHFGLADGWGLAKYHQHFRTPEERRRVLDWMAKRKLNLSHIGLFPTVASSGEPAKRVFGIQDREDDRFTFSGWPGALCFPASTVTHTIQDQLAYGRQRGVRWNYYLAYGNLPHQYRQMHPEYRFVGSLGYSATVLYPDDPECARLTRAFYEDLVRTYGTDHFYQDTPFVESTGSEDPEKSFELKLKAARMMCRTFKEIDPRAIWQSDSWDMGAVPQVWTPGRIDRYFAALPREMMRFYDTAADSNPFYQRTGYFSGVDWTFGILHSFQGDDHLHGDLPDIIKRLRAVSTDPRADRCRGLYHVPESCGHNLLYFEFTTRAGWDPDGLTVEGFLGDYVRRRYGLANSGAMLPAARALVKAVYSGGGAMPIYKKLGCGYGPADWWPIVGNRPVAEGPEPRPQSLADLRECLAHALRADPRMWQDRFYATDVSDWARTAMAHAFNWKVMDAYRALRQGDADRAERAGKAARQCLALIEALLGADPGFSLQVQIDRALAVPGVNPGVAWLMKQHCVNDLYSANDVYEQMHWFYAPRMDVYLGEVARRARAGTRTIEWSDISAKCEAIRARWLEDGIRVPSDQQERRTRREIVAECVRVLEEVAR